MWIQTRRLVTWNLCWLSALELQILRLCHHRESWIYQCIYWGLRTGILNRSINNCLSCCWFVALDKDSTRLRVEKATGNTESTERSPMIQMIICSEWKRGIIDVCMHMLFFKIGPYDTKKSTTMMKLAKRCMAEFWNSDVRQKQNQSKLSQI